MEIPEGKDFNKYGWQMRSRCLCGQGHSTKCCGFASDLVTAAVKEERERCAKIAEAVDPVLASVIRKG
jgi:hypothetical protein